MNPPLLVAAYSLHFVLFPIPIITLFWKDQIGMTLTGVMLMQAVFGLVIVLCEFPSGYFADRAGYRTSLVVGAVVWLVGWLAYTRAASFAGVVIAEILLGAGNAFMSGADRALLWASLPSDGRGSRYPRWEGRLRAAGQTSEAASAAVGGWMYAVHPRLPFLLQIPAALTLLGCVVTLRDVRPPSPVARRPHLERALHVIRFSLWHHPRLRAAMALSVALGVSSFVMVWLIQPYMQMRGIPLGWFGPLWAIAHVWLAGVSLVSGRVLDALGARATLLGCCLLVPLGYAGLAASDSPVGLVFYLCFMTLRGLQAPILSTIMQADAPPEDRASVLSLAALVFRLAFVAVGPPIGALVDRAGMPIAFATLAVVFTSAAFIALTAFFRAHRDTTA